MLPETRGDHVLGKPFKDLLTQVPMVCLGSPGRLAGVFGALLRADMGTVLSFLRRRSRHLEVVAWGVHFVFATVLEQVHAYVVAWGSTSTSPPS